MSFICLRHSNLHVLTLLLPSIQIASLFHCTVISTSSSNSKLTIAKSLGATHTINYIDTPNWDDEVLRLTNGSGVDHVLEVGGGGTVEKSLRCVRQGGLVSVIGFLAGEKKSDLTASLLYGGKTCEFCSLLFFLASRFYVVKCAKYVLIMCSERRVWVQ